MAGDPAALRRAAEVLRYQIVARNELARWLGDALDSLRVLRAELAEAREALAAKAVECDVLKAKCHAQTAELARIRSVLERKRQ